MSELVYVCVCFCLYIVFCFYTECDLLSSNLFCIHLTTVLIRCHSIVFLLAFEFLLALEFLLRVNKMTCSDHIPPVAKYSVAVGGKAVEKDPFSCSR